MFLTSPLIEQAFTLKCPVAAKMSVIEIFRQLSKILVRFWWRPTSRMKSENCGRRRANLLGMEIEFYQVACHTRRRWIKS